MLAVRTTSKAIALACLFAVATSATAEDVRTHIEIRGIYGGVPVELIDQGGTLKDHGINAVFMGSGALTQERQRMHGDQKDISKTIIMKEAHGFKIVFQNLALAFLNR